MRDWTPVRRGSSRLSSSARRVYSGCPTPSRLPSLSRNQAAFAGVVALDFGDTLLGPQARAIDVLELYASPFELVHDRCVIVDLERYLRKGARGRACRAVERKLAPGEAI